ncbi:addiction module antidote protein [Roseitalea porphyridii]|uniref:Putative addiction module antidote protein n=1 Tax=Roseitalea porphyridii TaxID=1852022 RepID=A0A4P6V2H7_9HYPH|nr:addiction module antidote protein [Roseitalea porphyridii]QBK31667.1 putative addiction module antidote protein [Roseitalea porphyridii]
MVLETTRWDTAESLRSPEYIAAYLEVVFEEGDPAHIGLALDNVARSEGLGEIARKAGVSREALAAALTDEGDPRLSTFIGVMKALGLRIVAEAA